MTIVPIKTLTIGDKIYVFKADEATEYSSGFISAEDKEKLDGIAEGATANEGTVKQVVAGAGLTGGTITENGTIALEASGVAAGNYGPTGNIDGNDGTSVLIPYITVDSYGRITSITTRLYTSKNTVYEVATETTDGLMSAEDKAKLNAISAMTEGEVETIFSNLTSDTNPNIYDLTAITDSEIDTIFSDY